MQIFLSNGNEYNNKNTTEEFTKINLNTREVKAAKRIILKLIENVKTIIKSKKNTSFYFTLLIVMNQISQDLLRVYPAEEIKKRMSTVKKQDE